LRRKAIQIHSINDEKWDWDPLYPVPVVIDIAHHMVHDGKAFKAVDTASAVTSRVYRIATPTNKSVHMVADLEANDAFRMDLYESSTATASGVAVPVYNMNRNSARTSDVAVSHTPGGITPGTTIVRRYWIRSGTGPADSGGQTRDEEEIILKKGTTYIASGYGSSADFKAKFSWYETD
jgi:hypothetical protein